MSYSTVEARKDLLAAVADAIDDLARALAALGAAYEMLDPHKADELEVGSGRGASKRRRAGHLLDHHRATTARVHARELRAGWCADDPADSRRTGRPSTARAADTAVAGARFRARRRRQLHPAAAKSAQHPDRAERSPLHRGQYGGRRGARIKLEGALARASIRHATTTVAPTRAMADMIERRTGRAVTALHLGPALARRRESGARRAALVGLRSSENVCMT